MTYILTIYFISAFGITLVQEVTPSLSACKSEAMKIVARLNVPSFIAIRAECVMEIEV